MRSRTRVRRVRTGSASICLTSGSEGPSHDPYGYTEIEVNFHSGPNKGKKVEFHCGLGVSLKVDGEEVEYGTDDHENEAFVLFKDWTGFDIAKLERWMDKARHRCKKCGCTRGCWKAGYPGESFYCCVNCNEVMDCEFNPSAIE